MVALAAQGKMPRRLAHSTEFQKFAETSCACIRSGFSKAQRIMKSASAQNLSGSGLCCALLQLFILVSFTSVV